MRCNSRHSPALASSIITDNNIAFFNRVTLKILIL